jgi:hypothetical protein
MKENYADKALSKAGIKVEPVTSLEILCLKDVQIKPIAWLWKFWIALGKTTVLAGNGGEGKSTILCDWIGRATTGEVWPDGAERSAPCSVLILAAEDDVEDTVKPRLAAVGANMERVFLIRAVRVGDDRRSFNLQSDLRHLEEVITANKDIRLVIIDPISSYLGKVDSHKNAEVRSVLEPLGEMAARLGVAVVCNNHFSKGGGNANSRIIGSVAFVNQARAAFIVTPDAENEGRRLLMPSKNNIAPIKHGVAYRIEGCLVKDDAGQEILTSRVSWETEPVTITADQALAAHEDTDDRSAAAEAEEFLRDKLSAGPVAAKDGEEHARALGIAAKTLKRSRKKLGVIAEKAGLKEGWTWRLPPEGGQKAPKGATSETWPPSAQVGPLRGNGNTGALPAAAPDPGDIPAFLDRRGERTQPPRVAGQLDSRAAESVTASGPDPLEIPAFLRRERLGPPAIAAGPGDDLADLVK